MNVLLRRHFWVVHLLVTGLCAGLLGRAASHAVEGAFLIGGETPVNPTFRRNVAPAPAKKGTEADEIVRRDVFCSGCVAVAKGPETPGAPGTGPVSNEAVKTSLQIELVSTMISDDQAWSMAVLRDLSTKEKDSEMFNRGKKIFTTTAVVKEVQARRVYLDHEGKVEYLDLDANVPAVAAAAAAPAAATPPSEFGDLDKSIQCKGTNCTIERQLVDKALGNMAALTSMARLVPSMRDGKPTGFKMYAIRAGSLFSKLGMQNGDTLRQVNGNEMSTPDQGLQLLAKLRSASHLNLQLERRGETVTMDYTITN
jgi:general secretion pathway protein C